MRIVGTAAAGVLVALLLSACTGRVATPARDSPEPTAAASVTEDLPPWMSEPHTVIDRGTNPGAMGETLPEGQHAAVETYLVVEGDTAWDIARRFGVGEEQLIAQTGERLGAQATIYPGDRIQFGDPLTGKDYQCFFGQVPSAGKGTSCYDD